MRCGPLLQLDFCLETQVTFQCQECGIQYADFHKLKLHEGKVHGVKAPVRAEYLTRDAYSINGVPQCRFCKALYTTWSSLRRRIEQNSCPGLRRTSQHGSEISCATIVGADETLRVGASMWKSLSNSQSDTNGVTPLVAQAEKMEYLRAHGWRKFLAQFASQCDLHHTCGICTQWVVDGRAIRQHYKKSHASIWARYSAQYEAEVKQLRKIAVSPCRYCGARTSDARQHAGNCTYVFQSFLILCHISWAGAGQQAAAVDQEMMAVLGGLLPSMQALAESSQQLGKRQLDSGSPARRKHKWVKGDGKGASSMTTSNDLLPLIKLLVALVLRQGDSLGRLETDTGYFLALKVPGEESLALTMVKVQMARSQVEGSCSVENEPPHHPVRGLVARAGCQGRGALDQSREDLNPAEKTLEICPAPTPLKMETFIQQVKQTQQAILVPEHVTRFQATKPPNEERLGEVLPFLIDVSLRPGAARVHQNLRSWVECAALQLIGARLRGARQKRSQQMNQLQQWLTADVTS